MSARRGVVDESSAGLHPAKYFAGIARLASRAGATLHPYTAVTAIERAAGGFSVRTIRGEIRAREVLIATNGYTGDAFPKFQRRVIPMGSLHHCYRTTRSGSGAAHHLKGPDDHRYQASALLFSPDR